MHESNTPSEGAERFRAAVRESPALQALFAPFDEVNAALPLAVAQAQALGITVGEQELRAALRPLPIGMDRYEGAPPTVDAMGWLRPPNVELT